MENIKQYVKRLTDLYGESVRATPSSYGSSQLLKLPEPLREFYGWCEALETPFGEIYSIETALRQSEAEPFKSQGWFSFGRDEYGFAFWLCSYEADSDGVWFTSWDHDLGAEIGEAMEPDLLQFLEGIREEYEENRQDGDSAYINICNDYSYSQLYLTDVGTDKTKALVFLKSHFRDSDYQQTKQRITMLPVLIATDTDEKIDQLEKQMAAKGLAYSREAITEEQFFQGKKTR